MHRNRVFASNLRAPNFEENMGIFASISESKHCDHIVIPEALDTYYNCELAHFHTFTAKSAWQRGKNVCRCILQRNRASY